jgi:SsrA-binding protein
MLLVKNKKANYEYQLGKKYQAGIVLSGAEVKSLRLKHASLNGSYIKAIGNELFLINAQINPYSFADNEDYDPKQTRKLLLKKREIQGLIEDSQQKGYAIIPISFELIRNKIKVFLAVGKGKKEFEKRDSIKKRDLKRELSKQMKRSQLKI